MTTVLVVDDSTANRRLLHTLLSLKGHDVIEADNGGQALDIARRESPTIVVADVFASRTGGKELVRELREDPQTANIPVVAYGCEDTQQLDALDQRHRVDRVVARASDPGALLDAIDSLITAGARHGASRIGNAEPEQVQPQPTPLDSAASRWNAEHSPGTRWTGEHVPGSRRAQDELMTFDNQRSPENRPDESHQPFRRMVELAPVGMVLGSVTGEATYVNPMMTDITGVPAEQLLGTRWLDCLSPHCRRQLIDALAAPATTEQSTEESTHYRDRVERPDRDPQLLDVHLRRTAGTGWEPHGFVAFIIDATATIQTEERRHAEWERHVKDDTERATTRMESLRRFAGSVAHGYNNALAVILSYTDFLRDRIGEAHTAGRIDPSVSHDLNTDLASILEAGRRAAHLTEQLQSFAHRGRSPAPTAAVDLNAILEPEITALARRLSPGVNLHVDLAEGLRPVVADAEQIGEIVRNLAENAQDAMPGGGDLYIETAVGDPAMAAGRLVDEGHVRFTVRDTGQGMPPHIAQHALEPFFTTKPDSPGGGLGLTAVYGTVRQSGGDVLIESAPGAGSSIHVLFPVAAPTATAPPESEAGAAGQITETILVVDDEEPVRKLVYRILTKAGYQVLTAENAAEALEVARGHSGPVHCLITDLAMPGLPGTELTRRLRAERPELAVLYMSGYAEPLLHHMGNADNRTNLLPKPFSRVELLTAVRATIHEHRASRSRSG